MFTRFLSLLQRQAKPFLALSLTVAVATVTPILHAEEGMWTFDNPPLKLLKEKYNFVPTKEWLDHLRLSSVRLNDGGSGSFVSADGLLLTNHHVARGQLQKNSTAEHDYIRNGFYATTPDQEMKSPDLEVDVLESMENVTEKVDASGRGIAEETKALKARDAAIAAIEKESTDKTGLRSDVVALYNGGEYWLYRYKKYNDVRLVFAPEQQAAFFGGDPDNFTYPRYDLDMAIFRVYENDKPIHTDNFLKWNVKGAADGDLIFISGHPGSTQRQDTVAQLSMEREVVEPAAIAYFKHRIEVAQQYATQGPEQARQVATLIFGLQNALKAYVGRDEALNDKAVTAKKQAEETDFRSRIDANPEWKREYGNTWETISAAVGKQRPLFPGSIYRRTDSTLMRLALQIVQYVAEVKKPDGERLAAFHEAGLESLRYQLLSPAPIYPATEKLFMTSALTQGTEKLGKDDAYMQAVLQGGDPVAVSNALVDGTKLADPAVRKALLDGGEAAVAASTDPMIVVARRLDPIVRERNRMIHDEIESVLTPAEEKLGKARFLAYGKNAYPDATFTLRLSYGTVKGYPMNGTVAPPFTTFYGLYDRATSFSDKAPFDLAKHFADAQSKLNLATPIDFVSTGDIIGGNSGSPVVDRNGELVGLIFDGNIESLAGDFVYEGERNRAVAVHSAGMIEALRKLYGAGELADEIEGKRQE
ncbi:S46 family peptidase [Acidicapsa acidisoli]|uniref:S46 family peptidase n=1 Tax=Acidicapsa acidisoli TaxID=1615681 RepID=UPI0021E0D4A2|nr:S46 family peptidase [Acidicapsa acidisoli]